MQTDLTTHSILLAIFLAIAVGAYFIGRALNFFQMPKEGLNARASGLCVLLCIILYFALFKVIAPLIIMISVSIATGTVPTDLSLSLDLKDAVLVNLAFIWLSLALIIAIVFAFGQENRIAVWNLGQNDFRGKVKAILSSPLYYLLAFPWILVFSQIYTMVGIAVYGEAPPMVEQSMVSFLKQLMPFPKLFALTAFTVVFIVPIQEEILFRGLLQRWLTGYLGVASSIILTSVVFSFLHFGIDQGVTNFVLISILFVFSLFLGIVYEKFGTLWAPIALHTFFNGFSVVMLYLLG